MPTSGTIMKAVVLNQGTPTNSTSETMVTIRDMKSLPDIRTFVARKASIQALTKPAIMKIVVQLIGNGTPLNSVTLTMGVRSTSSTEFATLVEVVEAAAVSASVSAVSAVSPPCRLRRLGALVAANHA